MGNTQNTTLENTVVATMTVAQVQIVQKSLDRNDPVAEAKHVLQQLHLLCDLHPNFEHLLIASRKMLEREVKRTPKSDRDSVLHALERSTGGLVEEDIAFDTNLTRREVRAVLNFLIENNLVEKRRTGRLTSAKQGRIEYLYCLTHSIAASAYSSPQTVGSSTAAVTNATEYSVRRAS